MESGKEESVSTESKSSSDTSGEESANSSEYILQDSNSRYIEKTELIDLGLDAEGLKLARNEIFARYGRKFKETMLFRNILMRSHGIHLNMSRMI